MLNSQILAFKFVLLLLVMSPSVFALDYKPSTPQEIKLVEYKLNGKELTVQFYLFSRERMKIYSSLGSVRGGFNKFIFVEMYDAITGEKINLELNQDFVPEFAHEDDYENIRYYLFRPLKLNILDDEEKKNECFRVKVIYDTTKIDSEKIRFLNKLKLESDFVKVCRKNKIKGIE